MNRERFIHTLREPSLLRNDTDLPLMKELIEAYPYFPIPYMMLTKLLHEEKSIYFDKYLKLTAATVGDREVLYDYLQSRKEEDISAQEPELIPEPAAEIVPEPALAVSEEPVFEPAEPASASTAGSAVEELISEKEAGQEYKVSFEPPFIPETKPEEEPLLTEEEEHETEADLEETGDIEIRKPEEEIAQVAGREAEETERPDSQEEEKEPETVPPVTEETNPWRLENLSFLPPSSSDYLAIYGPGRKENNSKEPKAELRAAPPYTPERTSEAEIRPSSPPSFSSWLASLSGRRNQQTAHTVSGEELSSKDATAPQPSRQHKDVDAIIADFINKEPKIKPRTARFFSPENMAQRSVEEDPQIATETLANIYIRQGLIDKAIEIFHQLSLRNPEKNGYFAEKIRDLKEKGK